MIKNLRYLSIDERPSIPVAVTSGNDTVVYQMLVDTGADITCFPAHYAAGIGHDNLHCEVNKSSSDGIGGSSDIYEHTVRLSLFDPDATSSANGLPPIIWTSSHKKFNFVEKLNTDFGLIGRDIISEWSQICFSCTKSGIWILEILIP